MADIRNYIQSNLLEPLKEYPTAIQDTMLELITERLETLYNYTVAFPEIVTPNSTRLGILKAIATQFLFTIRDEADLQEQIDILDNILYVYSKRGSIDTIENMWKYYGGDLPKDVQVIVPSYNLFRYNISPFSGLNVFQDGNTNRTGIYEIKLINSTYDIPSLKEFLLKELVAAGNYIYFTNAVNIPVTEDMSPYPYKYDIVEDNLLNLQLVVAPHYHGLHFSGDSSLVMSGEFDEIRYEYEQLTEEEKRSGEYDDLIKAYNLLTTPILGAVWSGKENIFVDVTNTIGIEGVKWNYIVDSIGFYSRISPIINIIDEIMKTDNGMNLEISPILYSTPSYSSILLMSDLYNDRGEHVREKLFTFGESLLGESLGYEPI